MSTFTVATFNVKDYGPVGNLQTNKFRTPILARYLKEEDIAVLGVQEATKGYLSNLTSNLPKQYKIVGDYRQKRNPFFNEANAIITPHKIETTETIHLTYRTEENIPIKNLFDIHKRTATWAIVNIPNIGNVFIINVHLSYIKENPNNDPSIEQFNNQMLRVIKAQLNEVLELQETLRAIHPDYPIIIFGDYNSMLDSAHMLDYKMRSEAQKILLVPNILKTQKNNPTPVDYIFYSNDLELLGYNVGDKALDGISDHKILKAEFRRR